MYKIEGNIIEGIDPFIKFQTIKNPPAKRFVGNEKVIRTGRKSRQLITILVYFVFFLISPETNG